MTPKQLLAAALCLFLFSLTGDVLPLAAQERGINSPEREQLHKKTWQWTFRRLWNDGSNGLPTNGLQSDPEVRAAWGISDDQWKRIQDTLNTVAKEVVDSPEYNKLLDERETLPVDPYAMLKADEETQKKGEYLDARMVALMIKAQSDALDKVLTPDQKQKIGESQLAIMGEPHFLPNIDRKSVV
jgi:hypothetical protein